MQKREQFIFETDSWRITLNPDQTYLGRSYVSLKRPCGDLTELTKEEWLDFARVVSGFESAARKAFRATMFNWSCLMNDAYQGENPKPQVHWHVRPRYRQSVEFAGLRFDDKSFGHHYDRSTGRIVPSAVQKKIISSLQKYLID